MRILIISTRLKPQQGVHDAVHILHPDAPPPGHGYNAIIVEGNYPQDKLDNWKRLMYKDSTFTVVQPLRDYK